MNKHISFFLFKGCIKMNIEYNIKVTDKNSNFVKMDFVLITDGDDVIETYVLNPLTNQWCNDVKQATSNWTEIDDDLNTLLYVLHQFTYDSEYDIIFDFDYEDEGKEYSFEYICNNEKYNIVITVDSVEN